MAALAMAAGCQPHNRIKLKYYPGESKGDVFGPSRVAVTPAGDASVRQLAVGTLFDADGNESTLVLDDPPHAISRVVAGELDHMGLKAKVFASPGMVPDGYDYIAACSPTELNVVKRIDQAAGSFLMKATVRLQCALIDRSGKMVLNDNFSSIRDDPPLGEAAQRRRRVISDPGEALSAAISDAIDDFTSNSSFRQVLPAKVSVSDLPAIVPSATSMTPSPGAAITPTAGVHPGATATPTAVEGPGRTPASMRSPAR